MLYLLALGNTECREYLHEPLGTEQPHKIILKGNEEA